MKEKGRDEFHYKRNIRIVKWFKENFLLQNYLRHYLFSNYMNWIIVSQFHLYLIKHIFEISKTSPYFLSVILSLSKKRRGKVGEVTCTNNLVRYEHTLPWRLPKCFAGQCARWIGWSCLHYTEKYWVWKFRLYQLREHPVYANE